MPQTFNGIGTWYYGSKNRHVREGSCEHCGSYTELSSYDTMHFVVFLFIPVIPLGRYRVVDGCASCRKHYAVPLSEWQEQKENAIGEALTALERDPWNSEAALELVRTCASYHDPDSLTRHEASIDQALSNDAGGLAFLGSAYEYFHEAEKAEGAYRRALMVRDDPDVRVMLGILLMKRGRPNDAKELVWHLVSSAEDDDRATLYFLVEAYQQQAMHREAGEVLDAIAQNAEGLENDELFRTYRKRVNKRSGSTRPLASGLLKGKPLGHDNTRAVWMGVGAAAIVLSVAGAYLFYATQRVDLYLISGLDRPYTVRIAGQTHHLQPGGLVEMTVPRGTLVAEASESELGWRARVDITMATSFWSALLEDRTYVVNPDRTAVIVWERTEYRVQPVERELPTRVHVGRGLYTFDGLHFVFQEFPAEITLSSEAAVEYRDRIWHLTEVKPSDAYTAAVELGRREDAVAYLLAWLRAYPEDRETLSLATAVVPTKQFAELARPHLDARPLQVEWHRMYQTALDNAGRGEELLDRYRAELEADPDNTDLQYLLARVTPEPVAAEELMRASAEGSPPSAYGLHGLAYQYVVEGRFDEAIALSRRAQQLSPDNELFAYSENEGLLALRRFDRLIEGATATLAEDPLDGIRVLRLVRLYVAAGDTVSARATIDEFVGTLERQDREAAAVWRPYLDGALRLGTGDWEAFEETVSAMEDARSLYQGALARGDYVGALEMLPDEGRSAYDHLIVYLTARHANDEEAALDQLEAAADLLSQGTMEERVFAECLTGETPPSVMVKLGLQPDAKAIALAAIATASGDARLRALARKLNYQLSFERYYLERLGF